MIGVFAIGRIALMFLKGIPWQIWLIIGCILAAAGLYLKGRSDVYGLWEKDNQIKAEQVKKQIADAEAANEELLKKQIQTNKSVKDKYESEIKSLKSTNFKLNGLLLGPHVCDFSTTQASTSSTQANNGTGQSTTVLPTGSTPVIETIVQHSLSPEMAAGIETIVNQAEHDAAVARACQAFLRLNEFPVEK
jgi:hypothetical protein